jgi:hypothetical protein
MRKASFWLLTVGATAVAVVPLATWLLGLSVFDSVGLGLLVSAPCVAALLLWALAEVRRDPQLTADEREAVRRSVFFLPRWRLDVFGPWFYLNDRVNDRNTRAWLDHRAA